MSFWELRPDGIMSKHSYQQIAFAIVGAIWAVTGNLLFASVSSGPEVVRMFKVGIVVDNKSDTQCKLSFSSRTGTEYHMYLPAGDSVFFFANAMQKQPVTFDYQQSSGHRDRATGALLRLTYSKRGFSSAGYNRDYFESPVDDAQFKVLHRLRFDPLKDGREFAIRVSDVP